jgi:hypothetical protein
VEVVRSSRQPTIRREEVTDVVTGPVSMVRVVITDVVTSAGVAATAKAPNPKRIMAIWTSPLSVGTRIFTAGIMT